MQYTDCSYTALVIVYLCVNLPQVSILLRHETCRILISTLPIQQPSPLVLDVHTDSRGVSWCLSSLLVHRSHGSHVRED